VWRKLKRLGAILLHDAVWVLPATSRTREQFQWLATEIHDLGGSALLWEATEAFTGQDAGLVEQFMAQVDGEYREILAELKKLDVDLAVLSRRYQQVKAQDYFDSPLGQQVRETLISARGGDEL
jgi:hypothetical protein